MAGSPRTHVKFRRLYDENFSAVRCYCLRRLPVSDANDAVAEVFLVAWRRIAEVPVGDEARMWLFGVARNVVRNFSRSERRRVRLVGRIGSLGFASAPSPETVVIRRSEDNAVLEALGALRPADQEMLRLSVWEELSNTEIAELLSIRPHAVAMRLCRARNRLAKRLGAEQRPLSTWTDPLSVRGGGDQ